MSNLIPLPDRATDTLFQLVTDATAYFYVAGSTDPLTVYADPGLQTPLGSIVDGLADGTFPQCWTDEASVKIDIEDGDGVSLPGFERDNVPTQSVGGVQASAIAFTPKSPNSATSVQEAVSNNIDRLNLISNGQRLPSSTGAAGVFAITTPFTIAAYELGQSFRFIAHQAAEGADTLNVDSRGATTIKKIDNTGVAVDVAAGDFEAGDLVSVVYDGSDFVIVSITFGDRGLTSLRGVQSGTFSPELADAETGGNAFTPALADFGIYRRIADLVIVEIDLQWGGTDDAGQTAGNSVFLRSLPYAPRGIGNRGFAWTLTTGQNFIALLNPSGTVEFAKVSDNAPVLWSDIPSATPTLRVSAVYLTDDAYL